MAARLVGLAVAMVVLLVAFGSLVAMGLPIGLAVVGILTSMGLVTLGASVVEVSTVAPTIATMIGLGVGIDYALFIVTRHRENLRTGMTVEEAAGRAIATSGAAVLFAGITVMIAISGLAIAGISMVTIMGLAASLTVAVMVAIALTLLPALLGFTGHRREQPLPVVHRLLGHARSAGRVGRSCLAAQHAEYHAHLLVRALLRRLRHRHLRGPGSNPNLCKKRCPPSSSKASSRAPSAG